MVLRRRRIGFVSVTASASALSSAADFCDLVERRRVAGLDAGGFLALVALLVERRRAVDLESFAVDEERERVFGLLVLAVDLEAVGFLEEVDRFRLVLADRVRRRFGGEPAAAKPPSPAEYAATVARLSFSSSWATVVLVRTSVLQEARGNSGTSLAARHVDLLRLVTRTTRSLSVITWHPTMRPVLPSLDTSIVLTPPP